MVSGYYGLLRIGEIVMTECKHFMRYTNLYISREKHCVLLVLRTLKTHNWSKPLQLVKIYGIDQGSTKAGKYKYCPYHIIHDYLSCTDRAHNSRHDAMFMYRDRTVKAQEFQVMLKEAINVIDLDKNNYNTHSLHIGRVKDLQKSGVSVELIKSMGRWKSNAIYKHLNKL